MNRAFDSRNTDVAAPDEQLVDSAPESARNAPFSGQTSAAQNSATTRRGGSSSVCPFCGTVAEAMIGPCRQCGMENSTATRQATRSKIGPWFVWQARNPSAPGMNWATLTSLVAKGRITPRSIVRGPTTGQLWRYAARVKGLSRELGMCWHCGMEIRHATRLCPTCKRMQQPPINPDSLLETDPLPAPQTAALDPRRGLLSLVPEPVRREVPPARAPASPVPQNDPSPDFITSGAVQMIDMGEEATPAGVELRAFKLPGDYAVGASPRHGMFRRIFIAATLGVVALAGGLYFSPQVRPYYVRWFHALIGRGSEINQRLPQTSAVDGAGRAELATPVTPTLPGPSRRTTTPAALMNVTRDTSTEDVSSELSRRPAKAQTQAAVANITLSPGKSAAEPSIGLTKLSDVTGIKMPATNPAVASQIQISPPPTDPQAAERRAWELYDKAIKAEQREDYRGAVKEYEWIDALHLEDGVGPSDVQSRLERARQFLKQREK